MVKQLIEGPTFTWFMSLGPVEKFYASRTRRFSNEVFRMKLDLSPYYKHHTRSVFGLQDWLIATSGISRAIMILGLLVTEKIAAAMYRSEIIKHLFMTRKSLPVFSKQKKGK